jgi:hypothetical protein
MRYVIIFVLISLTLASASIPVSAAVIGKTDEEVRAITKPILDNILDGMRTGDYAKWSRDLDETMKENFSEENFLKVNQQIQNQIGDYVSCEYLGFLKKGGATMVLWKGTFDNTEDDVLITLIASKRNDKCFVTGLWFK